MSTAKLADTDFTAEKQNIHVVHKDQINPYLLSEDQEQAIANRQKAFNAALTVPRRPHWDSTTTPEQLDKAERESFLEWRRGLASLQDENDLLMTPFERNLEVWRQLWRVIERSDLIVQIVDARNPVMFRSEDLDKYVKEVDAKKNNLLLVNKADLLTANQRKAWATYFEEQGISFRFFSAALAKEKNEAEEEERFAAAKSDSDSDDDFSEDEEEEEEESEDEDGGAPVDADKLAVETAKLEVKEEEEHAPEEEEDPRTRIMTVDELEEIFLAHQKEQTDGSRSHKTTIGLVGYPNVGKSSTINALIGAKKVSVSSTPGKTKHFQTLHLSDKIMLCDCPGLVFPNFASTKGELVCNGVLPIDQQREFTGPASLVARRIPQWFLERLYGIKIETRPLEEGGTGIPTGEELLVTYARNRGFMKTGAGNPDDSRAARYILKDYVNGKLLFVHPPPVNPPINENEFNSELYDLPENPKNIKKAAEAAAERGDAPPAVEAGDDDMISFIPEGAKTKGMDAQFFARGKNDGAHMKNPFARGSQLQMPVTDKGRALTGRKAKTLVSIDNDLSKEAVARLMGGSKKHNKGGKKAKKRLGVDHQGY